MRCYETAFLILLLAASILLAACAAPTASKWQEQYDLGMRFLSEGNYEEAIVAFTAAIEIDPKQAEAYVDAAKAYIDAGDEASAAEWLQKGMEQASDTAELAAMLEELGAYVPEKKAGRSGDNADETLEVVTTDTGGLPLYVYQMYKNKRIKITNVSFDKSMFMSGQNTGFVVDVAYSCPEEGNYVLMIGANTMEPDSFSMTETNYPVSGTGSHRLAIDATPVQWDDVFFGIYVNISDASHPESWKPVDSDIVYFDDAGNVVA